MSLEDDVALIITDTLRHPVLQAPLRVAACLSWLTISFLSLRPGGIDPDAAATKLHLAMAYMVGAMVTRFALRRLESRYQLAAFLGLAALLQIRRLWLPLHSAAIDDWAASSIGALLGLLIARAIHHQTWRLALRAIARSGLLTRSDAAPGR